MGFDLHGTVTSYEHFWKGNTFILRWDCYWLTYLINSRLLDIVVYGVQNSPCDPCMVHCCMHWCANCQEHREMQGRLSDNLVMPMTVINPPPAQEMTERESATVDHKEHAEIQISWRSMYWFVSILGGSVFIFVHLRLNNVVIFWLGMRGVENQSSERQCSKGSQGI